MKRRHFLKYSFILPFSSYAFSGNMQKISNKTVILIELKGGNDGLNTIIPYTDPLYYKLRPTLAIDPKCVIPINETLGFHPALLPLNKIYEQGEMKIVQGVGYEHPNLSHFRSIDIWDTASESFEYKNRGWLVPLMDAKNDKQSIQGLVLGGDEGPLKGGKTGVVKIHNLKNFLKKVQVLRSGEIVITNNNRLLEHILETELDMVRSSKALFKYLDEEEKLTYRFEKSLFAKQMELTTKIIIDKINIPVIKLSLEGFDTHMNQANKHHNLLSQLAGSIATMRKNLLKVDKKLWDNIVIMTYSEFGRRAAENANRGTDHGTAAPHFIIGGDVAGGIYGRVPSLGNLDENGNLKYTTSLKKYYNLVLYNI